MDNYEFYPVEITIPENFIAFRGFFRDWQSVHCVILFILTVRLYRIYIMSKLMKTAEEFLSIRSRESDYGVLAVGLLRHPLLALEKKKLRILSCGNNNSREFHSISRFFPRLAERSLCNSVYSSCTSISNRHHVENNEDC